MNEVEQQREYYAKTAAQYDQAHIGAEEPEHDFAMTLLAGIAKDRAFQSFLDVGAGTGRGMATLAGHFPTATIKGVEPVQALREVAYRKGISPELLQDGDATKLTQASASIDCVLALGIMHHIPQPRTALAEMVRVARRAVYISDLNNFGCGGVAQKTVARTLRAFGLWRTFQYVRNGFKHAKYSEGDGIHYSYSLLDDVKFLNSLGCETYIFSTRPCGHPSLLWDSSHVAVLALKK